jgi:hypothetical protein
MPADPKREALQDARRTQAKFEKSQQRLDDDAQARRDNFERAKKAGATLREIGEAVGLHWTRVGNILKK